jgi:hypothetical protein
MFVTRGIQIRVDFRQLAHSEVEHLGHGTTRVVFGEEEVAGLEIQVQDMALVSVGHGVDNW